MDLKYFKHFGQVLNKQDAINIKGDTNRDKGGRLGSFILIILLILFLLSTAEAATCSYTISPTNQSFSSNGDTDSIGVTTQSGCSWTVTENLDWVSITSGSSVTGSGTVTYSVSFNNTGQPRKGTITIADQTFTIRQAESVFNDVTDPTYWAYHYIYAIYTEGITVGCSQNPLKYCPQDLVTREQMAVFIVRGFEGEPPLNYCDSGTPFPDVTPDMWSCRYIKRLKELGITTGYGDGTYAPYDFVPREQMATFLVRAVEGEPPLSYCDSGAPFSDVTPDMWSCRYIKRLKELGITTGYGDGTYRPYDFVPREQMVAFLARAFLGINGGTGGGPMIVASATIGPAGGIIEVTDSSNPLFGTKADIPPGALSQDTTITISSVSQRFQIPAGFQSRGPFAEFGPTGLIFNLPIAITLPSRLTDLTEDLVTDLLYEYVGGDFLLPSQDPEAESHGQILDTVNKRITYVTDHFSLRGALGSKEIETKMKIASANTEFGDPILIPIEYPATLVGVDPQTGAGYYVGCVRCKPREVPINTIVIHSTNNGGATLASETAYAVRKIGEVHNRNGEIGLAHFFVGRDGTIIQLLAENLQTQHVGGYNNDGMIGIELEDGGLGQGTYTEEQLAAAVILINRLMNTYDVPLENVKRHKDYPTAAPIHDCEHADPFGGTGPPEDQTCKGHQVRRPWTDAEFEAFKSRLVPTITLSPAIINATIDCILNLPPGSGSFTLWSGTISVTAPDNLSWTVNIPNLPEPGSTVTVTPSSGQGSMSVSVVIKYPAKRCWCPCSLSWASGPIAEFRFSDQSTTTTPAAVLGVEVDYSSCVC